MKQKILGNYGFLISVLHDLSRETEYEDDRGFFERILDKIDDWLD